MLAGYDGSNQMVNYSIHFNLVMLKFSFRVLVPNGKQLIQVASWIVVMRKSLLLISQTFQQKSCDVSLHLKCTS